MLVNNRFSTKNLKIYRMKCMNTRSIEYIEPDCDRYGFVEKNYSNIKRVSK